MHRLPPGYLLGTQSTRRMIDQKFADLESRLQGNTAKPAPAAPPPTPKPVVAPPPKKKEEITPEILAVLSAAVAAYLGKRAKIRSVRRTGGPGVSPWTQQGRVYIQGSHNLARQ